MIKRNLCKRQQIWNQRLKSQQSRIQQSKIQNPPLRTCRCHTERCRLKNSVDAQSHSSLCRWEQNCGSFRRSGDIKALQAPEGFPAVVVTKQANGPAVQMVMRDSEPARSWGCFWQYRTSSSSFIRVLLRPTCFPVIGSPAAASVGSRVVQVGHNWCNYRLDWVYCKKYYSCENLCNQIETTEGKREFLLKKKWLQITCCLLDFALKAALQRNVHSASRSH